MHQNNLEWVIYNVWYSGSAGHFSLCYREPETDMSFTSTENFLYLFYGSPLLEDMSHTCTKVKVT